MAISYDDWKKQYEGLTTEQQKNYANMVKGNATAEAYAKQYIQEKQNAGTFGQQTATSYTNANQSTNTSSSNNYSSNSNNQNGSTYDYSSNDTGSNNNNNTWTTNTNNTGNTNNSTSSGSPLSDWKNGNGWTYWKFTFDADEYLDESKFWKSNWEITVKEWTAAQTGRPDYEIETKERLTEMVNNLNTYWDSNPEFFNDRETFNRVFEYNTRQSQAQRDLLDSYWKKAQDYKKASSYNNSASFTSDLDSWNVSESEFEALKKYNQDVYIQWQKEMQDKLNAAIANLANPFSIDDMTTALNNIVEKFNLQAWDPYDIIWGWNQMMEKTWAWDSMNEAKKHFTAADDAIAQIKRIQSNYSSSTWGNQSDALVAARLQKATLPYETLLSNELSAWQHWQSLYNTQLWTANQYAQTIQMQAQEDQRIFNNKLKALWFAMEAYSYRTPEQQAQLRLQEQSIKNDMSLLQQSKQNDLALYNMAATTRLQNQLNYEMQDLTVTDPKQLRANLSNVLDQWYEQYWDIIERPKSQVIEDVLAYAKENWVSVWEALRQEFVKKLMEKPEYKNAINSKYVDKYMSSWDWVDNWDWTSTLKMSWYGNPPKDLQTRADATAWNNTVYSNTWNVADYAAALPTMYPNGTTYKSTVAKNLQCWEFVNDYLQGMGLGKKIGSYLDEKEALIDPNAKATLWAVAIFDYWSWFADENGRKYWHVAVVTWVDEQWNVYVTDANYSGNWDIITHKLSANDLRCLKGYYDPRKDLGQTDTQLESLAKDLINWTKSYSELKAAYWDKWLRQIENTAKQLQLSWYQKSTIITDPAKQASMEEKLRKEYDNYVEPYVETLNWANNMEQAYSVWDKNRAASTQTIVMWFNKILDPDSVVREWEYARTADGQSLMNKMKWKIENIENWWDWITKDMIDEVMNLARIFKKRSDEYMNNKAMQIKTSIDKYWLTPEAVLPISVLNNLWGNYTPISTGWISVDSVVARIKGN